MNGAYGVDLDMLEPAQEEDISILEPTTKHVCFAGRRKEFRVR